MRSRTVGEDIKELISLGHSFERATELASFDRLARGTVYIMLCF